MSETRVPANDFRTNSLITFQLNYGRKREILLNSHLELNRYFEAVSEWNDPLIRTRAEVLADRALRIWSYFGQEQNELDSLSRGGGTL